MSTFKHTNETVNHVEIASTQNYLNYRTCYEISNERRIGRESVEESIKYDLGTGQLTLSALTAYLTQHRDFTIGETSWVISADRTVEKGRILYEDNEELFIEAAQLEDKLRASAQVE